MPASPDEVVWCYRLLLGREPESEEVVRQYTQTHNRLELIDTFLNSYEFQVKSPAYRTIESFLNRFGPEPVRIDADVTPEQLAKVLKRTKECWSRLGETQPHWSVMSTEHYRPEHIDSTIAKFWQSGGNHVYELKRILSRVAVDSLDKKICVEYGCGVGRMTNWLAPVFGKVIGYDISPAHLELARERASELTVSNLDYRLVGDDPLAPLARCDVYYTRLVLQHNSPPLIKQLVIKALDALKPNGVAVFQVPTYITGYHFDIEEYLSTPPNPNDEFEIHCLPQSQIFEIAAKAGCDVLEVHEDGAAGAPAQCVSNLFIVRKREGFWERLRG